MTNVVAFPLTIVRRRPYPADEEINDIVEGLGINADVIASEAWSFEVACRVAVGRIGEDAATAILKDVIATVRGEIK